MKKYLAMALLLICLCGGLNSLAQMRGGAGMSWRKEQRIDRRMERQRDKRIMKEKKRRADAKKHKGSEKARKKKQKTNQKVRSRTRNGQGYLFGS
jgi:hypothetical protein